MANTVIEGVTVIPGGHHDIIGDAKVVLDDDGVVTEIAGAVVDAEDASDLLLVPAAVDVHLDNLVERRGREAQFRSTTPQYFPSWMPSALPRASRQYAWQLGARIRRTKVLRSLTLRCWPLLSSSLRRCCAATGRSTLEWSSLTNGRWIRCTLY